MPPESITAYFKRVNNKLTKICECSPKTTVEALDWLATF